jgi:hypothetical protein
VRRSVIAAALLAAGASTCGADERPVTMPTRDVDVTYAAVPPGSPPGAPPLQQRMRWSVEPGVMRLDPPSPDLYFVMNYKSHRLDTIRPSQRTVLEMDASGAGLAPGVPSTARFTKRGGSMVAGFSCTDWETRDAAGEPAVACLTADGVLLRAVAAGRVLIEARSVQYGSINASVFAIPPEYAKLMAPAVPPARNLTP